GRHVGGLVVGRVHGRHVHGQAAGELGVAALELHQHADAAAVDVAGDGVVALHADHAAHLDVLADLGDQRGAGLFHGLAVDGRGLQGFDVVDADGGLGDGFGEGDEVLVLGDEVGL